MSASVITRHAPAATNYASSIGLVVYESGLGEVTLAPDATEKPLGVIVYAEDADAGLVSVCNHGPCKAIANGVLTPGTNLWVQADGAAGGELVAHATGGYAVGYITEQVATVANGLIDIYVDIADNVKTDDAQIATNTSGISTNVTNIGTNTSHLTLLPAQIKSGVQVMTGMSSVAFNTAFASTDYAVSLCLEITDNTTPNGWEGLVGVTNKVAGGFTVEFYDSTLTAVVPTTVSVIVHWTATAYLDA